MEELVKLTLAVSIPLWGALAVIGVFAAYFGGVAGIGITFILVIVIAAFWNRTLISFSERAHGSAEQQTPPGPYDLRLRDIEAKLDEIYRRTKE